MDVIHSVDVNTVEVNNHCSLTKEDLWHHRFGHLSVKNLQKLARDKLVDEFDYSESLNIQFCENCLKGRQARTPFPQQYQLNLKHSCIHPEQMSYQSSGRKYSF